jgi:hypothetical protein
MRCLPLRLGRGVRCRGRWEAGIVAMPCGTWSASRIYTAFCPFRSYMPALVCHWRFLR